MIWNSISLFTPTGCCAAKIEKISVYVIGAYDHPTSINQPRVRLQPSM